MSLYYAALNRWFDPAPEFLDLDTDLLNEFWRRAKITRLVQSRSFFESVGGQSQMAVEIVDRPDERPTEEYQERCSGANLLGFALWVAVDSVFNVQGQLGALE